MSPLRRRLFAGLLLLVALGCLGLGRWQLRRLHERRAANAVALAGRAQPPVALDAPGPRPAALAERRVSATGAYDRAHELVIRGQPDRGEPGVHVVTPLRLAGSDTAVLVLRGFVPSPDAVTVDLSRLDEPGTVRVVGIAQPIGARGDHGAPLVRRGHTTWSGLDLAAVRQALPYPVLDVVIRQTPDSALPRSPRRLAAPPLDDGPHLNYAIQWFAFAGMAVVFAGIFGMRRG